jgi:hypothetical protein|tara:strand:- start:1546 stop:1719 length:174 start_codon:yes stop_codon:yes gene_type:complete
MKAKGIDLSGLTKNQKNAMKRHSVHHTGNHLKAMVNAMKKGATFKQSHKKAMKDVGK